MAYTDLTENDSLKAQLARTRDKPRAEARHLPGWMYTSQEVFEREIERLFLKEWLIVGRVEWPAPVEWSSA